MGETTPMITPLTYGNSVPITEAAVTFRASDRFEIYRWHDGVAALPDRGGDGWVYEGFMARDELDAALYSAAYRLRKAEGA